MKKILLVSSTGGHFLEMMQLRHMFSKYDYRIITEKTKYQLNSVEIPEDKIDYLVYGTKKNYFTYPFKLIFNIFLSLKYFLKFKPDVIISTGAHTAVPICYIGKIFKRKVIHIESFANIRSKTLSGRIIYPIADLFIVQWESMLELYPKAVYGGGIF